MKLIRYEYQGSESYGIIQGEKVVAIEGLPYAGVRETSRTAPLSAVRLLAPCQPSKIICLGINYLDHAKEMGHELPEEPLIFLKAPTAVVGPDASIVCPAMSANVHYEGELAVVIKKTSKAIKQEAAGEYILGYTCANDVTARDLQKKESQWARAKSFDTFCPLGPCIETDFDSTHNAITTRLNGAIKQQSNIDQLIFKIPRIIEFVSAAMTLNPGDVILTGTSSGVGRIQPGDTVEVEIAGIGVLQNTVC